MSEDEKRKRYLEELRRILPPSEPWERWLAETGELPPNFDALPSQANLPDPLGPRPGIGTSAIADARGWDERRDALKGLFAQWVVGTMPPPPDRIEARVLAERREPGATVREVQIAFGPERRASVRLEVLIPNGSGEGASRPGPMPVFMTQWNHRAWALIAVRRGYLGVVYAGADSLDDTDTFLGAYPEFDWSRLTRRAWAASRCVDYLTEYEPLADIDRIVLTGHSRNGKLSLIGAAFDERFSAVISSSSGAGGCMPFRYYGEQHFGESIELLTRAFPDWLHPRLRFFSGREHKLPVDMHELVALCAPRPCLLSIALNDAVESAWAMQQTYLAAQRVYRLLGHDDRLSLLWRPGGHETTSTLIEEYLDWTDSVFSHGPEPRVRLPERLVLPVFLEDQRQPVPLDRTSGPPAFAGTRAAVFWMLGEAPPAAPGREGRYGVEAPHVAALLGRGQAGEGLEKRPLAFGEYVAGDAFFPAGTAESGKRLPGVLWLHPFSVPRGYIAGYMRGEQPVRTLARAGFAVLGFDQIGHGRRIEEAGRFYQRHPHWSLLGKMVRDSQAALDALAGLPEVDPSSVWIVGYGLGAMVGLHLAALGARFAGLVAICPPPPFRTDTDEAETGGLRRWSRLHLLLPRLDEFVGREAEVPYDLDDLLAAVAPRPILMVSPTLDREAPLPKVTAAVESARRAFEAAGAGDHLEQVSPEDYNRFVPHMQTLVAGWLQAQVNTAR